MKNIEEQIWNCVSGKCSDEEKQELEQMMNEQPAYRLLFQEISALHLQLNQLELEEPSMGFQHNLMEKIALEPSPSKFPLIDKRIIGGIAGFFMLSILSLLAYAFYLTDWTATGSHFEMPQINWSGYFNKSFLYAFLFLDMILGLYFIDYLLRKKIQL